MKRTLSLVLVSAFLIISILHLLVYAGVQQVHRRGANDAPRIMANWLAQELQAGKKPADLFGAETIGISRSRNVQGILCDGEGRVLYGNLALAGGPADLPKGLAAQAKKRGTHNITWAPRGERMALVLRAVPGTPYVVGGCVTLAYTEADVMNLWELVLLSWIGCSIVLAYSGAVLFRRITAAELIKIASSETKNKSHAYQDDPTGAHRGKEPLLASY